MTLRQKFARVAKRTSHAAGPWIDVLEDRMSRVMAVQAFTITSKEKQVAMALEGRRGRWMLILFQEAGREVNLQALDIGFSDPGIAGKRDYAKANERLDRWHMDFELRGQSEGEL